MKPKITLEQARKVLEVVDAGLCHGKGKPKPGRMCVEAAVTFALGEPFTDEPSCVSPVVRSFKIQLNDKNWSSNESRAKGLRRIAVAQLGSRGTIDEKVFRDHLVLETIRVIVPIALRAAAKLQKVDRHKIALEDAAILCETKPTENSARKAREIAYSDAASDAAYAAASDAASAAAYSAAAYASDAASAAAYAAYAAAASASAYASAAASAAAYAASDAASDAASAAKRDEILSICAEIGVSALRKAGSPGIKFMDILCPLK